MTVGSDPQEARVAAVSPRQAGRLIAQWVAARRLGLLYAALVALTLAPIAIWPIPRSWDLVNHWARLTLYGMAPNDPLAALYGVKLTIIPNLGVDLLYLVLSPALSPESVIRLAWAAAIALPAWGAWRVNKALFASPQPAILLVPAISYNLDVTVGLINFALGMALAIHALAWWIAIDRKRYWTRFLLFNAISVALFFCHIAAYAAFVVIVALFEATTRSGETWRAWLGRNLQTPLFVALGAALWPFTVAAESRFGGPGSKIADLAAPMFDDSAFLGVAETMSLTLVVVALLHRRDLSLAPRMRWLLLGLVGVIVALPSARGAADFIDARLAVLLAYLALASLQGPRGATAARFLVGLSVAIGLARVGVAAPNWSRYEQQAAEFREAIRVVEPGSRVLVVAPRQGACPPSDAENFYAGLTSFVVIDRRAQVSALFTGKGMQPVFKLDPRLDDAPWTPVHPDWLARREGVAGSPNWRDAYGTLIALHVGCAWRPGEPGLTPLAETPEATIYRVR
ncbi:MAG: hypothetical protein ACLPGW_18050 [Roseiarcus sp.]